MYLEYLSRSLGHLFKFIFIKSFQWKIISTLMQLNEEIQTSPLELVSKSWPNHFWLLHLQNLSLLGKMENKYHHLTLFKLPSKLLWNLLQNKNWWSSTLQMLLKLKAESIWFPYYRIREHEILHVQLNYNSQQFQPAWLLMRMTWTVVQPHLEE